MGSNNDKALPSGSIVERICNWIVDIIIVVLLAVFVNQYIGYIDTVASRSMEDTLLVGDMVLVNRATYKLSPIKRFDIIVYSDDEGEQNNIKRVIGRPGETVTIKNGSIYIDGTLLDTGELYNNISVAGLAKDGVTLGDDEYFVLGDWLEGSEDSRFEQIGNIKKEDILGKVWFRVMPMQKVGTIE